MRLLFALLALPLVAGSATAETTGEGSSEKPQAVLPHPDAVVMPLVNEHAGQVVDPDVRCHDNAVVAEGRAGEGRFRREPAGPTPPPMYYAVDLEIGGCDVLLATTGEIRALPPLPQAPRLQPAQ